MKNALNWFELFTLDLERATSFYERTFAIKLQQTNFFGTPHAVFPFHEGGVGGALVLDAKRKPSVDGALVYLNANGRFDAVLAAIPREGGEVVLGKTDIGEIGVMALFRDCEGNLVGLHDYK